MIQIGTAIIQGDWKGAWEGIKNLFVDIWNGLVATITGILDFLYQLFTTKLKIFADLFGLSWNNISAQTTEVWENIKNGITDRITAVKDTVRNAVDAIVGFFSNLDIPEIDIPNIKLPHFSIKGEFSLKPPSVPKLDVDWYASGGIFSRPSIIGVGEAGTEAVLPIDRLDDLIASALKKVGNNQVTGDLNINIARLVVREEADVRRIAEELNRIRLQHMRGSGRREIND